MSPHYTDSLPALLDMQRALITHLVQEGGGETLIERLLAPRQKSGREIAAEALTGRMRAEAAGLRQSAQNAAEGKSVADTLIAAGESISESLRAMRSIAANYSSMTPEQLVVAKAEYEAASSDINNIVKSTSYNGMSLLDGTQWNNDERTADGKIKIRMGGWDKEIFLTDMQSFAGNLPLWPIDETNAATAATSLGSHLETMRLKDLSWQAMGDSFKSNAEVLERQAGILADSAARSILGARGDPLARLLHTLLTDQGNLVDSLS
jgi:flagellin